MLEPRRALIVEDDPSLGLALQQLLSPRVAAVQRVQTLAQALQASEPPPDVLVLDFALPDGNAEMLLDDLHRRHQHPVALAMSGGVSSADAFRLAQKGVRTFLQKPFDLPQFLAAWERTLAAPPAPEGWIEQAVGRVPLHELEESVRNRMIDVALARAQGNRRGAARLLAISRQLLQHMLRRREP